MKYIRTKESVYELLFPNTEHRISFDHKTIECAYYTTKYEWVAKKDVIKASDNIEDLFDKYVVENQLTTVLAVAESYSKCFGQPVYGAIWTYIGLIYIAKLTEKGWKLL